MRTRPVSPRNPIRCSGSGRPGVASRDAATLGHGGMRTADLPAAQQFQPRVIDVPPGPRRSDRSGSPVPRSPCGHRSRTDAVTRPSGRFPGGTVGRGTGAVDRSLGARRRSSGRARPDPEAGTCSAARGRLGSAVVPASSCLARSRRRGRRRRVRRRGRNPGRRRRRGSRGRRSCGGGRRHPRRRRGRGVGCGRCDGGLGGRRRGCRRRGGGAPRRKQRQRVHVGVAPADAYTQVDVGHGLLGLSRRSRVCDGVAFGYVLPTPDEERAGVREGGLVPVAGFDCDGDAVGRNRPREADLPARRRPDHRRAAHGDVDPSVLPGRIRAVRNRELPEDRAVGGPGPGTGRRSGREAASERSDDSHRPHGRRHGRPRRLRSRPSRCPKREHGTTVARPHATSNRVDEVVTENRGRGRCETRR